MLASKFDRVDALLLDEGEVPLLRVLADWRTADERVNLERDPGLLLDVGRRRDVRDDRAAGDVEADGELRVALLFREPLHRRPLIRARAGQADVELGYAQVVQEMEDLDLGFDV